MKEKIAIISMLATGACFANAQDPITADQLLWKTTFTDAAQTTATSVNLTNNQGSISNVTGTVTSLKKKIGSNGSESDCNLKNNGTVGGNANYFTPDVNIQNQGEGTYWEVKLSFSGFSTSVSLEKIELGLISFDGSGEWQVNDRKAKFSATLTKTNGDTRSTGTTATVNWNELNVWGKTTSDHDGEKIATQTSSLVSSKQSVSSSPFVINAGDTFELAIKCEKGSQSDGAFFGLESVRFYSAPIPEPSLFGVLAGLGALALVGTRRRRR